MKVRLAEGLQLIITPENYVEQVALSKWDETHQGAGGLLVEAYSEQNAHLNTAPHEHLQTEFDYICASCGDLVNRLAVTQTHNERKT